MVASSLSPTPVIIIDGDWLTRLGIIALLERSGCWRCVGECGAASEGLELGTRSEAVVAVVDPALPEGDGMNLLRDLSKRAPGLRLVVVSRSHEMHAIQRAMRAGACGYVLKSDPPDILLGVLAGAAAGRRATSPQIAHLLLGELAEVGEPRKSCGRATASQLSDREFAVYRQLGAGRRPSEIAAALNIAVKTVETHCERIKRKLDARTIAELRRRAAVDLSRQLEFSSVVDS